MAEREYTDAMRRLRNEGADAGSGDTDDRTSSGMGGTSDAGSAADDAREAANYRRGLPDDRTRFPHTEGAKNGLDQGTRGLGGSNPPPENIDVELDRD
jgi:hypothetical protein